MSLNIGFLFLHFVLYLIYAKDFKDAILTLLQLKPLYEGIQSILKLEQTTEYSSLKKIDAISRSMPSSALQLYGFFNAFSTASRTSNTIFIVSIGYAMFGTTLSLAGNGKTSGSKMFSFRFGVNFVFYMAEVLGRVVTVALMFTCVDAAAFAVLGCDFLLRWYVFCEFKFTINTIPSAFVWMGTDTAHTIDNANIIIAFSLSTIESFIFLVVLFTYRTDRLATLSDHGVSEAIYFSDPDGNGLEFYCDRPRDRWPRAADGSLAMTTARLDVPAVLAAASAPSSTPLHGAVWGHLHLRVTQLERSDTFYRATLGMELTQGSYPGARFLAADGYHHHLGLNTWGRPRLARPPSALGLVEAGFARAGVSTPQLLTDPDGVALRLVPPLTSSP
jgi:catechol 2,3-dioxygenase-like lactoylglutathione lyase family enzyme